MRLIDKLYLAMRGVLFRTSEMSNHVFKTKCHPQANGRTAVRGEQQWIFTFPLEDGSELKVIAGRECRETFKKMLEQEEIDDLVESNPAGN